LKNFKRALFVFLLLILSYTTINAEVIKIPPIVIKSKQEKKTNDNDTDTGCILYNLKRAINKNQKSHKLSKKEEAEEILKQLKQSILTVSHKHPYKKKKKSMLKRYLYKKNIIKKNIKSKISKSKNTKKRFTKKSVKKVVKLKNSKIAKKRKIKIAKSKKIEKRFTKKGVKKVVKLKNLKIAKSKKIEKRFAKKDVKKVVKQIRKVDFKKNNYKHNKKSIVQSTEPEPIGFVRTLGVVGKSEIYEANDLAMDKREEIANDGVVDIPTATTDELKELPFVKPIEVIEVTQPFEASEATKYQLDKR